MGGVESDLVTSSELGGSEIPAGVPLTMFLCCVLPGELLCSIGTIDCENNDHSRADKWCPKRDMTWFIYCGVLCSPFSICRDALGKSLLSRLLLFCREWLGTASSFECLNFSGMEASNKLIVVKSNVSKRREEKATYLNITYPSK